jgi:probable HAF family extracellular repeat protein
VSCLANAHAVASYSLVDLGTMGMRESSAWDINAAGHVVGIAGDSAFKYSGGSMESLGSLGGNYSAARDINAAGHVVGIAALSSTGPLQAFSTAGGSMQGLGSFGSMHSEATAINDTDQVVINANSRSVLYSAGHVMELGSLGGGRSEAHGINNAGQVVGSSLAWDGRWRAFLYENGGMRQLDGLHGGMSRAYAINESGEAVGLFMDVGLTYVHAFVWRAGQMHDIGTLDGAGWSEAFDINGAGQVVGRAVAGIENHGFLYSDGAMWDLNALLVRGGDWIVMEARGINDAGQIAATAWSRSLGTSHAVLLNPVSAVPEPGTAAYCIGGLAALVALRRHQRPASATNSPPSSVAASAP